MSNLWLTDPRAAATRLRQLYRDLQGASGLGGVTLSGDIAWEWSQLDVAMCEERGKRWTALHKLRQALVGFESRFEMRELEEYAE